MGRLAPHWLVFSTPCVELPSAVCKSGEKTAFISVVSQTDAMKLRKLRNKNCSIKITITGKLYLRYCMMIIYSQYYFFNNNT